MNITNTKPITPKYPTSYTYRLKVVDQHNLSEAHFSESKKVARDTFSHLRGID